MTLFFLFRFVSKAGRCKATAEITLLGVRHGSSLFVEAQINKRYKETQKYIRHTTSECWIHSILSVLSGQTMK